MEINTIYDGCGIHVAQMKAMRSGEAGPSAHFPDAYFSCDVSFMSKVQQWFEASTIISRNDMVLCVPKGNPKQREVDRGPGPARSAGRPGASGQFGLGRA